MANTKSAAKNIRKSQRRRVINKTRVSALRSQIKKLRAHLKAKDASAASQELTRTISIIDRSIRKGVLHQNTAARTKSRLTRAVRGLGASKA